MSWDTHPHDADGFLYILQPTVVFAARVNLASASYPTAEIPYDGVTVGAYTDLQQGMTVLIGSTAGAYDRGRSYVRANGGGVVATAGTLYIGYSSRGRLPGEVDLVDDSYITVVDLYEPWRRASRMSAEGSIYKDYELVVAANANPICQMGGAGGPAIMDFVDAGTGVLAVTDLTTAGSRVMATSGALTNPAWAIGDGTYTSGSSSSVAPDLSFPAGKRWISVIHNDSNGRTSLPRRALVVALADADDTILRVSDASWRLTPAGVTLRATLRQRLDPADYLPGTVVIWLVQERRAGAASSLTGYAIKFAGWLDEVRSTVRATRHGAERVSQIVALDVGGRHDQLRAFASTMARESTIFNANQMQGANIDRYLWWYLHYHSFLPCFADLTPSGDALHPFMSFSSPGGSFSEVGDQLAKAIGYRLTVDSRGRVALVVDPLRQELVDRSSTILRAIAPADIRSIERLSRSRGRVGVVRATFALASTTDASALAGDWPDIYAKAPGDIEGASPGEQQIGYPQLAQNASEAQLRTGQDYARANNPEDRLRIHLAHGGDAGLEPALLPWVSVSTDEETVGWLDEPLSAERCLLTATEYRYDDEANALECSIEVERETDGTRATDDAIAGANTPRVAIGITNGLNRGTRTLFMAAGDGYIYYCGPALTGVGFDVGSGDGGPEWARVNTGEAMKEWEYDAFCPQGLGEGSEVRGWLTTNATIFRVTNGEVPGSLTLTRCKHLNETDFAFTSSNQLARSISSERGTPNRALIVSAGNGSNVTRATWTVDGTHWADEVTLDAANPVKAKWPAAWVSPRSNVMIASSNRDLHRSTTESPSFGAAISGLTFTGATGDFWWHCGGIHVPFSQTTDDIAYIGGQEAALNVYRVSLVNGTLTDDVTPVGSDTRAYAPHFHKGISSSPVNRNVLVVVGYYNLEYVAIFRSLDAGDTWYEMVAPIAYDTINVYHRVEVVDDDTAYFFGTAGHIGICTNLSSASPTIDDRRGNIPTDFPSIGAIVGIWGAG